MDGITLFYYDFGPKPTISYGTKVVETNFYKVILLKNILSYNFPSKCFNLNVFINRKHVNGSFGWMRSQIDWQI